MVPQTLLGLFVFLVLLGPGFIYVRRVEQITPAYRPSVFRETVTIVALSVACISAALVLFALFRIIFPAITPDVGEIVRTGESYLRQEYDIVGYYFIATYGVSLALAFAASHPSVRSSKILDSKPLTAIIGKAPVIPQSGWTRLFDAHPGDQKRVSCRLIDGAWIDGWLAHWNVKPEEDHERSLTLAAPIRFRGPEARTASILPGVQYSTVTAGQISRLDIYYVPKSDVPLFDDAYMQEEG